MHIAYTVVTSSSQADVAIDCPACGAAAVASVAHEQVERAKLLGLLPILQLKNTWVECGNCHKPSTSSARIAKLRGLSAAEVSAFLRHHPSRGAKMLSVLSFLLSWVPLVGLLLALAAAYSARGTKGWPLKLSILSLILSAAVSITVVVLMFIH